MPEGENTYEYPEQLLAGSDRPRPLPPLLRARLEEALEGMANVQTVSAARPLSGQVRDKLADSLRLEEPDGPEGLGGPEELEGPEELGGPEGPQAPERKWRTWAPRLSVAAAVIIALAIFVPTLAHGPGGGGASHTAAGVPASQGAAGARASRAGMSIRELAPNPAAVPPNVGTTANGGAKASGAATANGGATAGPSTVPSMVPSTVAPPLTIPRAGIAPAAGTGTPTKLGPDKSSASQPSAAFAASAPVVTGLSPATGPQGGGNWVTVRGTGLSGASTVYFGQVPATRVSVVSGSKLRAMAPAHAGGTVDVVVKGPAGQSEVSGADRYSYGS